MEIDNFKLLKFLKDNGGLFKKVSIAPLIDELVTEAPDFSSYRLELRPVYTLIGTLLKEGLIRNEEAPSPNGSSYTWEIAKEIKMELTTTGDNYLRDNERGNVELTLNQLLVDSHDLTQRVNESVINTNNQMITISRGQSEANRLIADNSSIQTTILDRQKWVLWASVFVAACSAFISYLNYQVTASNSQSPQEIKTIEKRLDTLQQQLSGIRKTIAEKSKIGSQKK